MKQENLNWYKTAKITEELLKEASLSEWIASGIMGAIIAVLTGSTIIGAAQRHNISEETLNQALMNKPLVERVQQVIEQNQPSQPSQPIKDFKSPIQQLPTLAPEETQMQKQVQKPITNKQVKQPIKNPKPKNSVQLSSLVNAMLQHEGLLPGQTPFRITSPKMRKWNSIYGFKIDKTPNAPSNRRNFIFLENPAEVPLAVQKLLQRYYTMPERYGLKKNPTLADALKKFDQTGYKGKVSYLQTQIPNLDVNRPLQEFIN